MPRTSAPVPSAAGESLGDRVEPRLDEAAAPEPAPADAPKRPGARNAAQRQRERQQRSARAHEAADERAPEPAAQALPADEPAAVRERDAAPEQDDDVPDFVRRARRQSRGAVLRSRLMLAATLLLALLLAGQAIYYFRDRLAARWPQAKPALIQACALLGCRIGLPAQIDMVSLESQELQTMPNQSLMLTSVLRNRSTLAQAWPHLEVTLTDNADKALARRVFAPAEYLAGNPELATGLAPRSEMPVRMYFDAPQIRASGYRVYIFYP